MGRLASVTDESRDKPAADPDEGRQSAARNAEARDIVERAAALGYDPDRVANALGVRPAGRDERAHDRDVAADKRDAQAATRDRVAGGDEEMTDREREARRLAKDDREAAAADRRDAAADRASAADVRDASRRSGE